MKDFLVGHALANVWCNPFQDRQAMLQLHPLTGHGGVRKNFSYLRRQYPLPTPNAYYHVYAIGQGSSTRLNLPTDAINRWTPLAQICQDRSMLMELYTTQGIQFSRSLSFMMFTEDGFFLFAVRRQDTVANLDDVTLFIRFQSNSFFESVRDTDLDPNIQMSTLEYSQSTQGQLPNFQYQYHVRRDSGVGHVYAFHNGRYVKDWLPSDVAFGDVLEWVYDTSVKEVHDFFLDDLRSYNSTLDSKRKYFIHLPKSLAGIDYRDDLDIYLVQYSPTRLSFDGVCYHKNLENSLRMVTHRDYGMPEDYVNTYISDNPEWVDRPNQAIRVHVKHSGYARPLIDEHQRIKEFYGRFDDQGILEAVVGDDAVLTEWQAAELEKSMYTRIMRSKSEQVTPTIVSMAYGYNAMAKITADTPQMVVQGSVALPVGLRQNVTAFEYDVNGLLLGWRHFEEGINYYPVYPGCVMVEFISGKGDLSASMVFGNSPVTLSADESYRFYVSPVVNGVPTQSWSDETGNTEIVTISNGVATWNLTSDFIGCVKGNSSFLCYDFQVESDDNTYKLSVNQDFITNVLHIPGAKFDLFMNKRAMVENIDYYMVWPQLHIVSKKHLKEGNLQDLTIRMTGFCNPDMSRPVMAEVGFVHHGYVSVDNEYDVRDDKVIRCVVAGKTYHRSQIDFEEDRRLMTVPRLTNGAPYSVENIDPPVRGVIDYDTYPLISRSKDLDARVSAYLTQHLDPVVYDGPNIIPELYPVFSPLIARLIWELHMGLITPVPSSATDMQLAEFMDAYSGYFQYDPAYRQMDMNYVEIHPHPYPGTMEVTQTAYAFLERVIRIYLESKIDLTPYVTIELP